MQLRCQLCENRYHDQGDASCVWADIPPDLWHLDISAARLTVLEEEWKRNDRRITLKPKTENVMTKVTRIRDKLVKVSESFTVNMYDNGFMVEIKRRCAYTKQSAIFDKSRKSSQK